MIELTADAKAMFFDRIKVMQFVDEQEAKAFNRIGGRIRVTAQRGMRKKGKSKKGVPPKPSAPGSPPKRGYPTGEGLSKILYHYDPRQHRVVVGPLKFGWSEYPEMTVPQLHEFGGSVTITEMEVPIGKSPQWVRVNKRWMKKQISLGRKTRTRKVRYPARPFMYPALEKNKTFIADAWSGARASVGG